MTQALDVREMLLSEVTVWTIRDKSGTHRNEFFRALANHEYAERILNRALPLLFSKHICNRGCVQEELVRAGFLKCHHGCASITGEGLGLFRVNRARADMDETYIRTVAARFDVQASSEPYHFPRAEFARSRRIELSMKNEVRVPTLGSGALHFAVAVFYKVDGKKKQEIIRFTDWADFFASVRALQKMTGSKLSTRLVEAALLEHASVRGWKQPFSAVAARLRLEKTGLLTGSRAFAAQSKRWVLSPLCEQFLAELPTTPSLSKKTLCSLCERFADESESASPLTPAAKLKTTLRGEHLLSYRASRKQMEGSKAHLVR